MSRLVLQSSGVLYWLEVVVLGVLAVGVLWAGGGRRLEVMGGVAAVLAGGSVSLALGTWYVLGANAASVFMPMAMIAGALAGAFVAEVSGRLLPRGWRLYGRVLAVGWAVVSIGALFALAPMFGPALLVCVMLPAWIAEVARIQG